MKKLLSLLVCLSLIVSVMAVIPVSALASGRCGDNLNWSLENKTLTISGTGDMYDYEEYMDWDPEDPEDDGTVHTSAPWDPYRNTIETLIISPGVMSIGESAFTLCKNIKSITIGEGMTELSDSAFYSCSGVNNVTLPDSLTSIGSGAFAGTSLASIDIPNGVVSIGNGAFSYCNSLTEITIPDNVESLGSRAFYNCTKLERVVLGSKVDSIKDNTFEKCKVLVDVNIPDSVLSIGNYAFLDCYALNSITVGDGVKTIGNRAFYECRGLNSVDLGRGVETIGNYAFSSEVSRANSLREITIRSVPYVYANAFKNCDQLTDVYLEGSSADWLEIRVNAEDGNAKLKQATVHYIEPDPCAAGHSWDVGTVTLEPTYETEGVRTYTCLICGETYTEIIPVMSGRKGDVNGDGVVSVKDLQILKRYVAGSYVSETRNTNAFDVDGDGIVSVRDITKIKRIIASAE